MKKIVVAIDSFKGCLSSTEVEQTVKEEIQKILPDCWVECVPIADGGEGMLDVMVELTQGHYVEVEVHDPLMRLIKAHYGVTGDKKTAIVEMAQASGLPLLMENERNPMETTSYGTGELIAHALSAGFHNILIGIGGSATNDSGMGMMQALGAKFYDEAGAELSLGCGKLLSAVAAVDLTDFNERIKGRTFATACDVNNPFCGKNGAAYVFARQKGASPDEIIQLDKGLEHFSQMVEKQFGQHMNELPGAGAAGGVGGALSVFFHSVLKPGIDLILEKTNFSSKLNGAELLITGEGKADRQTLMGKVPAGVLKYSQQNHIPVILMAGAVENSEDLLKAGFSGVYEVTPREISLSEALLPEVAKGNLCRAVGELLRNLKIKG